MNKLITIGAVGIAAYGLFNLLRMKNVADQMHVSVHNPRIHKIDWNGISFKADARISNPTRDSMSLTKPVISLLSKGKTIVQSKPENQTIRILPLTTSHIEGIEIPVAWTTLSPFMADLVGKLPSILASAKGKKTSIGKLLDLPLEMSISTYADNIFIQSPPVKLS